MNAQTIQVCALAAFTSAFVVAYFRRRKQYSFKWIDYGLAMAVVIGLLGSVESFDNKLAEMTGGKSFPIVTTAEKTKQQEIREANEKERLRQERNNRATQIIKETTYIEVPQMIGGPICFAVYRDQLGGQVDCKIVPPELLGIADVK
jgi:hypothetical protein